METLLTQTTFNVKNSINPKPFKKILKLGRCARQEHMEFKPQVATQL